MAEEEFDVDKATQIVKDYFERVKGAKIKIAERPLIDWMDFTVNSAKEEKGFFEVRCEFNASLFSEKRIKYRVSVSKKGEITEVTKEDE